MRVNGGLGPHRSESTRVIEPTIVMSPVEIVVTVEYLSGEVLYVWKHTTHSYIIHNIIIPG